MKSQSSLEISTSKKDNAVEMVAGLADEVEQEARAQVLAVLDVAMEELELEL